MGWTVSLGKQMGRGLLGCGAWRTSLHAAPSGDALTAQPGGEMLQSLGCEIPQMFRVQRCSKGSECRDTPKVLGVRCSEGPGGSSTPKVLGVEVPRRC